jgi:hypothetical protein
MKGEPEWFDLSDSKVAAHQIEVNLSMMLSRRKGAGAGGWGGGGGGEEGALESSAKHSVACFKSRVPFLQTKLKRGPTSHRIL